MAKTTPTKKATSAAKKTTSVAKKTTTTKATTTKKTVATPKKSTATKAPVAKKLSSKEILAMLIAYGLLLLIKFPPNIGPVACATYLTIRDAIKIKKECKKNSLKATRNLENLYSDINFDQSDMSLSMTKMNT